MRFLGGKGGHFEKLSKGSKTSDMTSEGLGRCVKVTLQTHTLENFRSCRILSYSMFGILFCEDAELPARIDLFNKIFQISG
jgi:hypothetical protein